MQGLTLSKTPLTSSGSSTKPPLLPLVDSLPCFACISRKPISTLEISKLNSRSGTFRAQASNVGIGSGGYEGKEEQDNQKSFVNGPPGDNLPEIVKQPSKIPYPLSIAIVLLGCTLVFSLIAFVRGGPSSILAAIAKSGLTAAFTLIFVSEIGDKTFFIAALLAMQYEKGLVLLGSMGALSLMTILSVVIGRIFNSVPAQFQTTLPIGEYAAVTLLMFFGLKSIKDAWDLPSKDAKTGDKSCPELDEYAEAEELVKEKVSKPLTNPFEIVWKSFSLVFFAEWGDRSMLATIALGAAQSPWGVATGAIAGHLVATTIAILGGAFLANYISEKLSYILCYGSHPNVYEWSGNVHNSEAIQIHFITTLFDQDYIPQQDQARLKHRQIKMSTEVMFLRSHCYHVPERTSPLLYPCTYSVYASIRSDHPVRLTRRRLTAPKLLMLPQVQRPNRKSSPLTTITAAAAGVPLPPLDLTEENVKQLGQIFDSSVGITGQVELAELDGPFVVISLKGRFWHERSMVLARIGNYLKQRIPEILEVEIEDEKQLDDSPENF
ncbi:protein PAM71 [Populus alba x Populus x berolinensis]|nr:protein PAM71 [Populus alba x Populus x berolinensis]